jgi:hypothetical protein
MKAMEVLARLRRCNVPFVICTSCGMRHIREPHDLDIQLKPGAEHMYACLMALTGINARQLSNGAVTLIRSDSGRPAIRVACEDKPIEIFNTSNRPGFAYNDLYGYDIDEEGNLCWTLEHTREWKITMGREKDLQDLKLIDTFLKENPDGSS